MSPLGDTLSELQRYGRVQNSFNKKKKSNDIYGYEIREPYDSELQYFKQNPNIGGMATEDNRVILNPFSRLNEQQKNTVALNEAIRLFLKEKKYNYDFDVTSEQIDIFRNTPYGNPENINSLKETILGRIITQDPSIGVPTEEQRRWADRIFLELKKNKTK